MKKILIGLTSLIALSACQTTSNTAQLRLGEVFGTEIGSVLANEAGLSLSAPNSAKMNSEVEKALFFSGDSLTTKWYAGTSARIRPLHNIRDRRDRTCRRFRHGVMIDNQWQNGTAIACREQNVAWYLIENQWDQGTRRNQPDRERPWHREEGQQGNWENLSGELGSPNGTSRW